MRRLLKILQGTNADKDYSDFAAAVGASELWGVMIEGTTTAIATIDIYDNVSNSGTVVVGLGTNLAGSGTTFEKFAGVMFPRPVKMTNAISADITGTERYWIYYS